MANVFLSLPVPAGNGVGAWVDVSTQGPERTIVVDGGAFDGQLAIEGSNDGQVSAVPASVGPFSSSSGAPQTFVQSWNFLRVRRSGSSGAGSPNVNVSAPAAVANVFAALAVPAGDGAGAPSSISSGGDINTFGVAGPFTGTLSIETSADGVNFSPALLFTDGGGKAQQFVGVLNAARVRRSGTTGGAAPRVSVGSSTTAGAGVPGGGTVTNITSTDGSIAITNPTTTPDLSSNGVQALAIAANRGLVLGGTLKNPILSTTPATPITTTSGTPGTLTPQLQAKLSDLAGGTLQGLTGAVSLSGGGGVPMAGLKLWVKADVGITLNAGNVSNWADQSGSGNNAPQVTPSKQPPFNASGGNGLGGVTFPVGKGLHSAATSILAPLHARTVVVVASNTDQHGGALFQIGTGGSDIHECAEVSGVGNLRIYADESDALANQICVQEPSILGLHEYEYTYSGVLGDFVQFAQDGENVPTTGGPPSTIIPTAPGFNIGSIDDVVTDNWRGDIHEVLLWDHVLSASDMDAVRVYLSQRYARDIARTPVVTLVTDSTLLPGPPVGINPLAALTPDPKGYFAALFQQKTGLSPLLFGCYYEPYLYRATLQPGDYGAFPSGGATAAWNVGAGSGIMTLTGPAGAGQCDWSASVKTVGPYPSIANARTKRWLAAYLIACHKAPAAGSMVCIGGAAGTSFFGLGYVGAAANWQYVRGTDGAIVNLADTGKAIDATGTVYLWMYVYNDGTNVHQCIDVLGGVPEAVAEASTNLPTSGGYEYLYNRGPAADVLEYGGTVFCQER